jgi:DNA polymerase family A
MARAYPAVAPLRELRATLSGMRLSDLAVGADGRNRTMLSAFRARTGRNQPSNTKFIFGPSVWLRGLIQPPPGYGIAYIDWAQQEFGIAAALSGDFLMMEAYRSGDPYLAFAKQAGAAPPNATKATHKAIRDQFKSTVLAVQYGMGADALAQRLGQPPIRARELLRLHRETYRVFWTWSERAVDYAMLTGSLHTAFGWRVQVPSEANARSLANFPMQANGAEMLRLACSLATEQGIEVCAPVHDAVLICAPLDRLDHHVARMQDAMREASRVVLDGFELGTDAEIIRYPDRYADPRGAVMWERVMTLIHETAAGQATQPLTRAAPKCGCCRTEMRIRQVSSMSPYNSRWDPSCLRLDYDGVKRSQGSARRGRRAPIQGKFIAGPIPVAWVVQASRLGVKALLLGLALWHLKKLRQADTFTVSNLMLQEWGVQPDAKSRALRSLEKAGLIRVERRGKCSPRIALIVTAPVREPDAA